MSPTNSDILADQVRNVNAPEEIKEAFSSWVSTVQTRLKDPKSSLFNLLSSIPAQDSVGYLPLLALKYLISQADQSLPAFDIIRCYNKLWIALPESAKTGLDKEADLVVRKTYSQVKSSVGSLTSLLLLNSDLPALVDPTTKVHLTHRQLSLFIHNFDLPISHSTGESKPIIVIALPNGPLLGIACLAVSSYYTAVPLNTSGGARQFRSEVELASPDAILVLESDFSKLGLNEPWVIESGIQVVLAQPDADMTFTTQPLSHPTPGSNYKVTANSGDDISLLLFTSGTSGTKKKVPVTCIGLLTGITCVIDSWGLTVQDSCLNMMPLNHVGGLVRNLFAPVLSGGSTILCPAFDPNLFWDILQDGRGSWYYASPSMHMSILAEGSLRPDILSRCHLRLVCNAAGGLLPALAIRLRDAFKCTVLPSYGMTECMPISTPPLGYTLDRTGTSGIGCGPEISILDETDNKLSAGQVGRINVRGGPLFNGYLKDGQTDKTAFNKDGWFDTGDLGSLDQDGFLYLTGRGKEVINRGGELISPFEVEEAITIASQNPNSFLFRRVDQVMAFSAPHQLLQEVVGVALVLPPGKPRPDIRDIHGALKTSLHVAKLPIVVVYINALPTSNNKIVRIKFGERLDLEPVTAEMTLAEKHYEAICPPVNSNLNTKVAKKVCSTDVGMISKEVEIYLPHNLEAHVGISHHDGTPELFLAPKEHSDDSPDFRAIIETLRARLKEYLDGIQYPSKITYLESPFPRFESGLIDDIGLHSLLEKSMASKSTASHSDTESQVRQAFSEVLDFNINEINSDSDFFELGGDSLSAGRLLSIIRRDLQVRIPVDQLFVGSRVCDLCALVSNILKNSSSSSTLDQDLKQSQGSTRTYSSTNPFVLIVNVLPIILFYPMKMGFQWTILMYSLSSISEKWNESNVAARFLALVASMFISRALTQIVAPFCGIAFKWIVIKRFEEGTYPMWGVYHTRWWIVQKVLIICGKGVFRHFDVTRLWYYRLLGAKIGKGVTIEKGTILGEYDLLDIGDNVHLNRCICRPFAAERNTSMYLGKIIIGKNSSIGLKTHISAGSTLPEDSFLGANSSSYEINTDKNQEQNWKLPARPHFVMQIFCILPVQVLVLFVSSLPWMAGLWGIVKNETKQETDSVRSVITWWATPHRIGFHYLAQSLNVSVRPFIWFGLVVVIKHFLNLTCGRSKPGPVTSMTRKDRFRTFLLNALIPNGSLKSITKLFGTHYEFTSMAVRALGGKVGKRVYWPGTGPSITDFDLVDIGNDVVFGSRSHLITTDTIGSAPVHVGDNSMIADRVILSPGATVGEGAVLGSGAFVKRDQDCPPSSVWVGNRAGGAVCLSATTSVASTLVTNSGKSSLRKSTVNVAEKRFVDSEKSSLRKETMIEIGDSRGTSISSVEAPTSTPFGRAFYLNQASYHVLGQLPIFLYSTFTTIFVQMFWNAGTISTIMLSQIMNNSDQFKTRSYKRPIKIYIFAVLLLSCLYTILSIVSLSICIAAKWSLIGRRKPGSYDWESSSYCQRWQIFLTIEAIRRRCFGGNGVIGMLTGTHFCTMYFRALGANIGKDCALFVGGRPSLVFTEPDLLTLGDRVCVDDASLVGHINSRGWFSLRELKVGGGCVLRSGSRLLAGAKMGKGAMLLEHTLIMAGDEADEGTVYQGWPADVWRGPR